VAAWAGRGGGGARGIRMRWRRYTEKVGAALQGCARRSQVGFIGAQGLGYRGKMTCRRSRLERGLDSWIFFRPQRRKGSRGARARALSLANRRVMRSRRSQLLSWVHGLAGSGGAASTSLGVCRRARGRAQASRFMGTTLGILTWHACKAAAGKRGGGDARMRGLIMGRNRFG
jgi:hypothetical protein